jgi:hypothetical protein
VSRWLLTDPLVINNQPYKNGERESRPHRKINREEKGWVCGEVAEEHVGGGEKARATETELTQ